MFGRSKSSAATGNDEANNEVARLPGLPPAAAKMLPFLQAEPPCSSCAFTMTPQGRDRTGACSLCSAPSAAEPLGFLHECLTCGRRLCAGCSQKEAVGRLTKDAKQEATERAKQTGARLVDEACNAEEANKRTTAKLADTKSEREAFLEEARAEQTAARLGKESLSSELQADVEALKRGIAESESELKARDLQLCESLKQLRTLHENIAAAPRPPPDEDDETLEARAEIQHYKDQKISREAETLRYQEAAHAEEASETNLRCELESMQETAVVTRARRLCTLAFARSELNCERRAAEEAAEAELVAAMADEAERERERQLANERQRAVGASAAIAAASNEPPVGGGDVFGKFFDKLTGFVENIEPFMAPAPGDVMWGLPMDMQMGMPVDYGMSAEAMTMARVQTRESHIDEPQDEEAKTLQLERTAWERKSVACEKQLEWMQRDAARRSNEIAQLKDEVARLRNESAHSYTTAAELEKDLEQEKDKMQEHHQKLRTLLEETVVSCRDRILAALRHGNSGEVVRTKSELESLYDDSVDWAVPGGTAASSQLRSSPNAETETVMAHSVSNSDYDTFVAGLEALCDDLERQALAAAEDARDSGNLNEAIGAFNVASDAMEAFDGFPESPVVTPVASKDNTLDKGREVVPPSFPQIVNDEAFPEALLSIASSNSAWPEAGTASSIAAENR